MKAEEMWELFSKENHLEKVSYEAWAFGASADQLAELVMKGMKTGTSSAYDLYHLAKEPLPKKGEYSVLLNARGEAQCVLLTMNVELLPFREISALHAYKEGEGDRTLAYWRRVHEAFFKKHLSKRGLSFHEDRLVVYEEFRLVYPISM